MSKQPRHKNIFVLPLLLPLIFLAGCSAETLTESSSMGLEQLGKQTGGLNQATSLSAGPIETYIFTARMVRRCWLNATNPLIPNHVFYATATRKGGEKAHIGIHRRAKLGRKGPMSFAISFTKEAMGTSVAMKNYQFTPELTERLKQDVNRWTSGDATCPPPQPILAGTADGDIPAPIPKSEKKKIKKKKKSGKRKRRKSKKKK